MTYLSEQAREKYKLIGPYCPEGYDVVNKDEEYTEGVVNGAFYKGTINKST